MIRQIAFTNVGPYRGSHVIELGPQAYAFTARYENNAEISNGSGKSFIFEMIVFALTGQLNKFRRYDADGWITRGEKKGEVSLLLEGDVIIKRSRTRGQSTQIEMTTPHTNKATQGAAEANILKHLAFDADDLSTVAYFEQRQMARIILTEPEKRLDVVRGWFDLAFAENAEKRTNVIAIELTKQLQKLRVRRETITTFLESFTEEGENEAELTQLVEVKHPSELKKLHLELDRVREIRQNERDVQAYDALVERGKSLASEVESIPKDLEDRVAAIEAKFMKFGVKHAAAKSLVVSKRRVALGQFDGHCPIADIQCPAQKTINNDREASAASLSEAEKALAALTVTYEELRHALTKVHTELRAANQSRDTLERLREEVVSQREEVRRKRKEAKTFGITRNREEIEIDMQELSSRHSDAVRRLSTLQAGRTHRTESEESLKRLHAEIDILSRKVATTIQARSIFRATQRRVAERALNVIGARANDMLLHAGVDLSIDIRWEREGKNLAKSCEMCGASFPTSAKIKECEECGAERGQNVVQRLEFLPSQRSGGKDDLAGITMQLSAGSWLLGARHSPWSTAMIDEPYGALDKQARRALATQLVKMIGGGKSFRQLLCISHSSDTTDMFPAKIEIVVAKDGSRRIVQS